MTKKLQLTQEELNNIIAQAVASALAQAPTKSASGKGSSKNEKELVEFKKHDGTIIMCTKAQAQAWEKYRDGYTDRVASKEANLKKFEADRKAYKPSQALVKAIKADRASITLAVAKAQYDFVGTKKDLAALKDKVCK